MASREPIDPWDDRTRREKHRAHAKSDSISEHLSRALCVAAGVDANIAK